MPTSLTTITMTMAVGASGTSPTPTRLMDAPAVGSVDSAALVRADSGTGEWKISRPAHDPQAEIGRVSALLAQEECKDRKAPQPRYLHYPRCRREARAGGAVLQARQINQQTNHKLK